MPERLQIVQVTPFAWEGSHEVNAYARAVSEELAARGHRVLIAAPSESQQRVRDGRRAIRAARTGAGPALHPSDGGVGVIAVGEVLPFSPARRRSRSLPIDVARTVEELLDVAAPDILHVHEPLAPSTAGAALRHSRALNVGSFHAPAEHTVSTQVARRMVEVLFGRLDARTASYPATRELMARFFPADYRVIVPGASAPAPATAVPSGPTLPAPARVAHEEGLVRIAITADEERGARRLLLRALRRLPLELPWRATVWSPRDAAPLGPLRAEVRERVIFTGAREVSEAQVLAGADIAVAASGGAAPAPGALLRSLAAGAVPLASRLGVYEEAVGDGAHGLLFEPGDVETLAAQLGRLISDVALRERLRAAGDAVRARLSWSRVSDELEDVYAGLMARRHALVSRDARTRLARRALVDVDLHMHTDHSSDCATPVEVLLSTAEARGLHAIAVTDHNEVSGAFEARAKADAVRVIVGEEIKTAEQGEVIGLFLSERIPRGLTLAASIAEIKRQGGIVYVPHPFDRMHAVPDYANLLEVLDDVDAIEVHNPRVAITEFNEEAVRFAAKYRIPGGAGSDAHVAQGLGSVRVRMRDFDGPQEFLASLHDAEIVRGPSSLIYVQALKFLQTRATPAPARRASRQRRVRRATRKS